MFNYYVYILARVTGLFLDLTVHFENCITFEDGCLEKYHRNISV